MRTWQAVVDWSVLSCINSVPHIIILKDHRRFTDTSTLQIQLASCNYLCKSKTKNPRTRTPEGQIYISRHFFLVKSLFMNLHRSPVYLWIFTHKQVHSNIQCALLPRDLDSLQLWRDQWIPSRIRKFKSKIFGRLCVIQNSQEVMSCNLTKI